MEESKNIQIETIFKMVLNTYKELYSFNENSPLKEQLDNYTFDVKSILNNCKMCNFSNQTLPDTLLLNKKYIDKLKDFIVSQ